MKRPLFSLLICLTVLPFVGLAQGEPGWNKMTFGANFELSVPMGDFQFIAGNGYGGNVRFQYGQSALAAFTATAGYLVWTTKDLGGNTSIQPQAFNLFLGGKYYFAPGFFGTLEGGLYFMTYTYTGSLLGAYGNATRFMLPIGLGYQKSGFEVSARYMLLYYEFNSFSFTVGYNFAL